MSKDLLFSKYRRHCWWRTCLPVQLRCKTVACQAPPSMGFSGQECWSALPFPSPGDHPDSGIEPGSPALQADTLPSEPPGNPCKFWSLGQEDSLEEGVVFFPGESHGQRSLAGCTAFCHMHWTWLKATKHMYTGNYTQYLCVGTANRHRMRNTKLQNATSSESFVVLKMPISLILHSCELH